MALYAVRTRRVRSHVVGGQRRSENHLQLGDESGVVAQAITAAWNEWGYADIHIARLGTHPVEVGFVAHHSTDAGDGVSYTRWADQITAEFTRATPASSPELAHLKTTVVQELTVDANPVAAVRAAAERLANAHVVTGGPLQQMPSGYEFYGPTMRGGFYGHNTGSEFHIYNFRSGKADIAVVLNYEPVQKRALLRTTAVIPGPHVTSQEAEALRPLLERLRDDVLTQPGLERYQPDAVLPLKGIAPERRRDQPAIIKVLQPYLNGISRGTGQLDI